jgi:hypothetical protein
VFDVQLIEIWRNGAHALLAMVAESEVADFLEKHERNGGIGGFSETLTAA